jgi:hypothetical protein
MELIHVIDYLLLGNFIRFLTFLTLDVNIFLIYRRKIECLSIAMHIKSH